MDMGEGKRPNIVLILMDDMGYGDAGCYGSSLIRTPAMDRLAAEGALFRRMYAVAPICSPSRCGLLTGKYPQRCGIPRVLFPEDRNGLPAGEATIASVLGRVGYKSAFIGKWHLGCLPEHNPVRHGFDAFYGLLYSNDMEPLHLYRNETVIATEVDQAQLTLDYTSEAIRFIEDRRDEPFFCMVAHTMPHIPLHVPEAYRGKSAAGTYGDTIECIDDCIGRLLSALERLNLEERTLILVTSDNGPWFEGSAGGLRGRKFEVYEGGVRSPFIARWTSVIPPGQTRREAASLMDLLPTLAALAGAERFVPAGLDGKDMTDLLLAGGPSPHDILYFYYIDALNAACAGKWKLHAGTGRGKGRSTQEMPQLFDLERDEAEQYNVANLYPDVAEEMLRRMRQFDSEMQPVAHAERVAAT